MFRVDVYVRSLILPRGDNQTKYGNPAKLLIINANLATFKITVGGIRDLKYTLTEHTYVFMHVCINFFEIDSDFLTVSKQAILNF